MVAIFGGLCIESLWRGYCFAMNDIKKSKNISGKAYIQSFNANACVLLINQNSDKCNEVTHNM